MKSSRSIRHLLHIVKTTMKISSNRRNDDEDFAKFCGLLKKHKLYTYHILGHVASSILQCHLHEKGVVQHSPLFESNEGYAAASLES